MTEDVTEPTALWMLTDVSDDACPEKATILISPDYAIAPTFRSGKIKGRIFGFLPTGTRVAKIIVG